MTDDTASPTWHAHLEFPGALTIDQLEALAEETSQIHHDSHRNITKVHLHITATNLHDASTQALAALDQLPAFRALRDAGILQPPRTLTVQDPAAHAEGLTLLGTAEVAARLNLSTARVRQLRDQHPDFPAPALTLAGGNLYDPAAIDYFNLHWDRKPGPKTKAS
jgi:hypothetical protein